MSDWSSCLVNGVPTFKCLEIVFANLLSAMGGVISLILLIMFVYGSISWLTAGDSPEKLKKAKGTFFTAILGLAIIGGSYLILIILKGVFGIDLTTFKIVVEE